MSLVKKNWYKDVLAALEIVREEVDNSYNEINDAGGDEMKKGNLDVAEKALRIAYKIKDFKFELEKVGDKWQEIQELIDAEVKEVQEIVLPQTIREKKGGYTRNVKEISPWTNFTAEFENGLFVSEATAKDTFASALSQFKFSDIESANCMMNGEPLVSRNKDVFKKYPQAVVELKNGGYVSTYCSTATKADFIKLFGDKFKVPLKVSIIPHEKASASAGIATPIKPPTRASRAPNSKEQGNTSKKGRKVSGVPYKVSQVVCAVMPEVFKGKLITQEEVNFLLTKDSSKQFKTGGWAVLKKNVGNDGDRKEYYENGNMPPRYYSPDRVSLEFQGKKYYLTSQFRPEALEPVVDWLNGKGFSRRKICELVERNKK